MQDFFCKQSCVPFPISSSVGFIFQAGKGETNTHVSHTDAAVPLMGTPSVVQGLFHGQKVKPALLHTAPTHRHCSCSHPRSTALPNIPGLHMEPALPHKTPSHTPKPEQENVQETLCTAWIPADPLPTDPHPDSLFQPCSHTGEQQLGSSQACQTNLS